MVNKIYLMIALCLVLPLINADTFGTYPRNSNIDLNFQCQNSTYLNITKIYTNKLTYVNIETETTKYGNNYNYTFLNNSVIGIYNVNFHCDLNGIDTPIPSYFEISSDGNTLSMIQIYVYLFFLLLCLVLTYLSIRIFKKNRMSESIIKDQELYDTKKRNEFIYYMKILKNNLWIVGIFGIYLSLLIFFAILNQLVYNLGLFDLNNIIRYILLGFSWGLIPFTIFWLVYLIIVFYKSTTDIFKYQFGKFGGKK